MDNREGPSSVEVIPLRERQRLIMTYDAGETSGSPEQAEGADSLPGPMF